MTDRPIDLDHYRTVESRISTELRRKPINQDKAPKERATRPGDDIDAVLLGQPAQNWIEAAENAAFLLGRYAATKDANDPRIQKLIERAKSDLARLAKREETR